ncbi:3'-5' exonuclease [Streptomyces sp. Tu102]|uniref:3'-5' exonuclease n=1 Tax=Streptomyces TaxID=1883 RepID=UPI001BDC0A95|nr:3'-5' exonuclease [Streptomyces sp. Tu102]MBT1098377.1 3'-5' exonuclease [Streptomyces sp. Tu102]
MLDTETMGLHRQARIVELGVLGVSGDSLVDTLLNPGVPIPAETSDHHGITDDQVSDAPSFDDVLPRLTAALAGKRVLIYNAAFDIGRLRYELTGFTSNGSRRSMHGRLPRRGSPQDCQCGPRPKRRPTPQRGSTACGSKT